MFKHHQITVLFFSLLILALVVSIPAPVAGRANPVRGGVPAGARGPPAVTRLSRACGRQPGRAHRAA